MNDVGNCDVIFLDILLSNICQFDWLKTLYFQAKFGKERVSRKLIFPHGNKIYIQSSLDLKG